MLRIGIIGTENSHAMAFAKRFNLPIETTGETVYPNARVVMVYGPDSDTARSVMSAADVPACAESPDDFIGQVDAMMITSRCGSTHFQYALPFIQAGIPLFIDKPFTSDSLQAQTLIETALQKRTLLMGGSGCKYAKDVLALGQTALKWRENCELLSGSVKFTADPTSKWDGFFFYASHLVEIALAVFGKDLETIQAQEREGNVLALAGYRDFSIALHFTKENYDCECTLYGKQENIFKIISIEDIIEQEADLYMKMLQTSTMPQPPEMLLQPVCIIEDILESIRTGKPVHT